MLERRPMLGALIGLTLCLSLWSLSMQESPTLTEVPFSTQTFSTLAQTNQNHMHHHQHDKIYNVNSTTNHSFIILDLLEPNDINYLIDLDNFEFLINQKSCNDLHIQPLVLIFIHSAPRNWNKRKILRETWAKRDHRSRLIFLIGAVTSEKLQYSIVAENKKYGDIVQGNFQDSYRNMTYKHVMALKWFTYNCPEAKFILKTDDDVFVNTPNLYKFLENNATTINKDFLFCCKLSSVQVKRTYRSKWRVSPKEYAGRYYPSYCPGFSIVYSPDVAFQLYREAQITPYFWIDDVHITGTLAQKINTSITSIFDFYVKTLDINLLKEKYLNVKPEFIFVSPDLRENDIRALWKIVTNNRYNNHLTTSIRRPRNMFETSLIQMSQEALNLQKECLNEIRKQNLERRREHAQVMAKLKEQTERMERTNRENKLRKEQTEAFHREFMNEQQRRNAESERHHSEMLAAMKTFMSQAHDDK